MSKKSIFITIIIIVIFVALGFWSGSSHRENDKITNNQNLSNTSISQSNQNSFETINTVQELKTRLDQKNPDDILLDVRTPEEFSEGHIKNAVNIDLANPNFITEIQKLDKTKTYLVFCRTGNRALTASQEMFKIGLKTVYSKQGIVDWEQAGFETIK